MSRRILNLCVASLLNILCFPAVHLELLQKSSILIKTVVMIKSQNRYQIHNICETFVCVAKYTQVSRSPHGNLSVRLLPWRSIAHILKV